MLVSDTVDILSGPERTGKRIILCAPPCMALDRAHFTNFFFPQKNILGKAGNRHASDFCNKSHIPPTHHHPHESNVVHF